MTDLPEPWLRGTLASIPAVPRGVLHALQLAEEDLQRWCGPLDETALHARPGGIAPVAFHVRHISRSLDRLLTYAEGKELNDNQLNLLRSELDASGAHDELFAELQIALAASAGRIRALGAEDMEGERFVGKRRLSTTIGGLLVHIADHTQRHVGQAIVTAKLVAGKTS